MNVKILDNSLTPPEFFMWFPGICVEAWTTWSAVSFTALYRSKHAADDGVGECTTYSLKTYEARLIRYIVLVLLQSL